MLSPSLVFAGWIYNDPTTGLPVTPDPLIDPAPTGYFSSADVTAQITQAMIDNGSIIPALTLVQGQQIGLAITGACISAWAIAMIHKAFFA